MTRWKIVPLKVPFCNRFLKLPVVIGMSLRNRIVMSPMLVCSKTFTPLVYSFVLILYSFIPNYYYGYYAYCKQQSVGFASNGLHFSKKRKKSEEPKQFFRNCLRQNCGFKHCDRIYGCAILFVC